jgi:hypothetical protein
MDNKSILQKIYKHNQCNNIMKKQVIFLLLLILIIPLVNSQVENLGYFKLNDCVKLIQICSNCTYNNITSVLYPNSTIALSQVSMSQSGTEYTYNCFSSTSLLGTYIVNGKGDVNGVNRVWSYTFNVTGNGKENPAGAVVVLFILFFLGFLGILAYMFIYSIGHFLTLDFDVMDLAYNMGLYFVIFGTYMLAKFYLGNPDVESFLLLMIKVGALTHFFIPFLAFMVSIVAGSMKKKKLSLGYAPKNPLGRRLFR